MRVEMLTVQLGLALCASVAAAPNDGMVGYYIELSQSIEWGKHM